jgi:hypothetical protein
MLTHRLTVPLLYVATVLDTHTTHHRDLDTTANTADDSEPAASSEELAIKLGAHASQQSAAQQQQQQQPTHGVTADLSIHIPPPGLRLRLTDLDAAVLLVRAYTNACIDAVAEC